MDFTAHWRPVIVSILIKTSHGPNFQDGDSKVIRTSFAKWVGSRLTLTRRGLPHSQTQLNVIFHWKIACERMHRVIGRFFSVHISTLCYSNVST